MLGLAWLGLGRQTHSSSPEVPGPADLTHSQGTESRPKGPTPTHQSLKLLFGKAHLPFSHLVISVQGGLEDERVICIYRVVGLVIFESGYGGKSLPLTLVNSHCISTSTFLEPCIILKHTWNISYGGRNRFRELGALVQSHVTGNSRLKLSDQARAGQRQEREPGRMVAWGGPTSSALLQVPPSLAFLFTANILGELSTPVPTHPLSHWALQFNHHGNCS